MLNLKAVSLKTQACIVNPRKWCRILINCKSYYYITSVPASFKALLYNNYMEGFYMQRSYMKFLAIWFFLPNFEQFRFYASPTQACQPVISVREHAPATCPRPNTIQREGLNLLIFHFVILQLAIFIYRMFERYFMIEHIWNCYKIMEEA